MTRLTKVQCELLFDELIDLKPKVERAKEIEGLLKENLGRFADQGVSTDKGRAFVTEQERISIPVEAAIDELGQEMAGKVIVVKKSVSNKIIEAFLKAGEISESDFLRLMERAERKPYTSLYVRPLK